MSQPACAHIRVPGCECTNLAPTGKELCESCENNECGQR
ncbi:0c48ab0c-c746-4ca3-ae71-cd7291fba84d [Thermothielavioides terrestris]|uniref:0c48ab0c-c746-4ca3-ae71-cd7291fba84d n=1 Tax=Thermothielavioides terrestris TaxID=2587410 RepID=A0A446B6N8_9PEZI|nr:0c48ab0c-c746-4ca3-ae71-cd7291fba84d [Thermothielavioides terrestris]